RVPAHELKRLGIRPLQCVANILKMLAVQRVVIAQFNLNPDNEIHRLPPLVVRRAVGHIVFGRRQAQGVLVAAPVHSLSGVVRFSRLAQSQLSFLVPHPAE
ncbi:MAG: hypothetical protein J1F05_07640, partial [Muribaculaceae bacterium]|nr:hypothetical protein [Muribaculaceae bacterium]